MSLTIDINGTATTVIFDESISVEDQKTILTKGPLPDWAKSVQPDIYVESINVQSVDWFGTRPGFVKIKADCWSADDPEKTRLPGICFLRGGSVAVLVVLVYKSHEYVVVCKQPRIPAGRSMTEIIAGMIDDSSHFAGVAAEELKEEAGIDIGVWHLTDMVEALNPLMEDTKLYLSPGGSDEGMNFYLYRKVIDDPWMLRKFVGEISGRKGGVDAHEQITLDAMGFTVLDAGAALATQDAKLMLAMSMYSNMKTHGLVPEAT